MAPGYTRTDRVLELTQAGTGYQETLFAWIAPIQSLEVQRWQGQIDTGIEWNGAPLSSDG